MKLKSVILLLIVFSVVLYCQKVTAQSLSGHWKGYLSQNEGAPFERYAFEMVLNQLGRRVTGTSTIRTGRLVGVLKLQGIFEHGILEFEETMITLDSSGARLNWCIKYGALSLVSDADSLILHGPWDAKNCTHPGKIRLTRPMMPKPPEVATHPPDHGKALQPEQPALFFHRGEAKLLPASEKVLQQWGDWLLSEEGQRVRVEIIGHTDYAGSYLKNYQLSLERAIVVQQYLVRRGVAESRLDTHPAGESEAVETHPDAEQRQYNRRVEIKIRR